MDSKNIDFPVLNCLSEEKYISLREISNQLGISCDKVSQQIQGLKKFGYLFSTETNSTKKYKIIFRPDILLPQEIRDRLNTRFIGRKIYYFKNVDSTNIVARKLASNREIETDEGTVVIAGKQTMGKGRLGRKWISPQGGLWFSILLHPVIDLLYFPLLTLMTALVVTRVIRSLYHINAKIKWPNDILINNKKVCGILSETSILSNRIEYAIVGIGLNVNNNINDFPENISEDVVSLKKILDEDISLKKLMRNILDEFEEYYEFFRKNKFSSIVNEWKLYSNTIGKRVSIDTGVEIITGEAVDIDAKGALILKLENGALEKIISGTIIK